MNALLRLDRIALICADPIKLAGFYERALGFSCCGEVRVVEPAFGTLLGMPGACAHLLSLRLGEQRVQLLRIEPGGRAYPQNIFGPNALFQHFAIEVEDLSAAMSRLQTQPGWTALSVGGPQTLPPASGAVTAFKFKDPEGHPLELITPLQPTAGARRPRIGHSAISVAATARSIDFYGQLGLRRTGGSFNSGAEQDRLDGIDNARVAVTALGIPDCPVPHLELLCYQNQFIEPATPTQPNDVAATWLVFAVRSEATLRKLLGRLPRGGQPTRFADGVVRSLSPDPDGHWLCLEAPAARGPQPPVANPG